MQRLWPEWEGRSLVFMVGEVCVCRQRWRVRAGWMRAGTRLLWVTSVICEVGISASRTLSRSGRDRSEALCGNQRRHVLVSRSASVQGCRQSEQDSARALAEPGARGQRTRQPWECEGHDRSGERAAAR